jgi:predicted nucleic acid-binding protein
VSTARVVVSDANVLINFLHLDRLDLLGRIPGFEFVVIDEVTTEITQPNQRAELGRAFESGWIREERLEDPAELASFVDLTRRFGKGESASLAWAVPRDCWLASDERRAFRREALQLLGPNRLTNTAGLMVLAIRREVISVVTADRYKSVLEQHRFKMPFASFRDVL